LNGFAGLTTALGAGGLTRTTAPEWVWVGAQDNKKTTAAASIDPLIHVIVFSPQFVRYLLNVWQAQCQNPVAAPEPLVQIVF
jgi:hypothetical protein